MRRTTVDLVPLVYLVCQVFMVERNQSGEPDKPNRPDRPETTLHLMAARIEMMPQNMVLSPYSPLKWYCGKYRISLARGHMILVRNCLCSLFDSFFGLDLQRSRPFINGTSGFQEVGSSTSRSPSYRYRFLHEPRHQCGTGSWELLGTHDLIAPSTGIGAKRENRPDMFFGRYPILFGHNLPTLE